MRLLHAISYLWFMIVEVNKGSYQVASAAFLPQRRRDPMIIEFETLCRSDLEIAALASSITITPGTLVVAVAASDGADEPPTLFVHALFADSEEDAMDGLYDMETRLLTAMRGRAPRPVADIQKAALAVDDRTTDDQRGGSA